MVSPKSIQQGTVKPWNLGRFFTGINWAEYGAAKLLLRQYRFSQ
jgi:hypothetical protein